MRSCAIVARLMVAQRLRLGNKAVAPWLRSVALFLKRAAVAPWLRRGWRNHREPSVGGLLSDPGMFRLAGDLVGCHQLGPVIWRTWPAGCFSPLCESEETEQLAFRLPVIVMHRMADRAAASISAARLLQRHSEVLQSTSWPSAKPVNGVLMLLTEASAIPADRRPRKILTGWKSSPVVGPTLARFPELQLERYIGVGAF